MKNSALLFLSKPYLGYLSRILNQPNYEIHSDTTEEG